MASKKPAHVARKSKQPAPTTALQRVTATVQRKVIDMDYGKFARITSNLLVRKGDAGPSRVKPPKRSKTKKSSNGAANVVHLDGFMAPHSVYSKAAVPKAPARDHEIVITLTAGEHETLGLIAAKKGVTPHQIVRQALDGYFAWLADEYAHTCRCIASTCSEGCDHISAAEVAERLVHDRQTD